MRNKIILFPFGGNAREALISILNNKTEARKWEIIGFIDDNQLVWGKECFGVKVLGGRKILKQYPTAKVLAVPGNPADYLGRKKIIESLGIGVKRFATIVGPNVIISADAEIGYNTLLIANNFVSCGVRIGNNCVILPNTVISHDSTIGDYSCIGSGVSISGNVSVGRECYIGSKVSIREKISIGERSLIGIGANVICDVPTAVIVAGNPAKIIRKVK